MTGKNRETAEGLSGRRFFKMVALLLPCFFLAVQGIAWFVGLWSRELFLGALFGVVIVDVNFAILRIAISFFTMPGWEKLFSLPFFLLRVLLYAAGFLLCVLVKGNALVGFGFSVLLIVPAIVIAAVRENRTGRVDW